MKREAIAEQRALSSEWRNLQPALTEELLQGIARKIVERFAPERVILFGSHARGITHADSDIDLLVVMESDEPVFRRMARVAEVAHTRFLPMDVLVYTPAELAQRLEIGDHFIRDILTYGRTLYEREPVVTSPDATIRPA